MTTVSEKIDAKLVKELRERMRRVELALGSQPTMRIL